VRREDVLELISLVKSQQETVNRQQETIGRLVALLEEKAKPLSPGGGGLGAVSKAAVVPQAPETTVGVPRYR
jgi:hypothetical protein